MHTYQCSLCHAIWNNIHAPPMACPNCHTLEHDSVYESDLHIRFTRTQKNWTISLKRNNESQVIQYSTKLSYSEIAMTVHKWVRKLISE